MSAAKGALRRVPRPILLGSSIVFAVLAILQARTDGLTYDEGFYITSGLHAFVDRDLRVVPEAPPLAHLVATAPLLAMHPVVPRGASWERGSRRGTTAALLRAQRSPARLHSLIVVARIAPILEAIATAWCMAALADRLFGRPAGTLAGVMWLLNPLVLGLGHLVAMDPPAALTSVLVALAVLHATRSPSRRSRMLLGFAAGIAVLTRTTGLLMLAAALLAMVVDLPPQAWRRAAARAGAVLGTAWATVGLGYLLIAPGPMPTSGRTLLTTLGRAVAPPDWLTGATRLYRSGTTPGPALLLGQLHLGRWPIFWPITMFLKLPLPTVVLIALVPVVLWRTESTRRRDLLIAVVVPAVLLTIFVVQQERPIGLRYLLPALALWMVVAAGAAVQVPSRARVGGAALVLVIGGASLLTGPALSWTPPGLGPGYRLMADSNLDWGQAYPELQRWNAMHPAWVEYFGPPGVDLRGLPHARDLRTARTPITGWVAVSASALTVYSRHRLAWLRAYCPVDVLDRSILVFRFDRPPDQNLRGADVPPKPCDGPFSRRST